MSALTAEASTRRLRISRIAVVALALVSVYFVLHTLTTWWRPEGDFGIGIDSDTAVVVWLAPRNAAKGIRIGDRVDLAAMPFRERGYLYENFVKPVGWRMTVPVIRGRQHLSATFEIEKLSFSRETVIYYWLKKIVATLSIATGVILVWNRPSVMLLALAVFLIRTHDYLVSPLWSPGVAALIVISYAFSNALGLPALIVFASRFPTGRTSSATKYTDAVAAIPLFTARPIGDLPQAPLTIFVTHEVAESLDRIGEHLRVTLN